MTTIKIFLASSEELKLEREMMASLANSLNTVLEPQGVQVIVVEWENLDASMGAQHKQEDYNEKLRDCEMCLVLYWTKFGTYTKTELDTAYKELRAGNNPKKLYVYFKNGAEPTEELKKFRDSFPTRYGHFFTTFENFDTLKAHFLLQFLEYQTQTLMNTNAIEVKNGKVVVGGVEYVDLKNVPFAGNNEEYNEIKDEILELQEDLEDLSIDSPRYAKKAEKLHKLQEKLSKMENSLWDTALMITHLSTTKCSERLKRAMDLFSAGDNKGAQAVLNEEEIERDVEHNLHLIQLGEEGKKGLKINIEEYKLKIKTLENEMAEGWIQKIIGVRSSILELSRKGYGEESEQSADAYEELGVIYIKGGLYQEALFPLTKALTIQQNIFGERHSDTATSYNNLGLTFNKLGEYEEALRYQKKALDINLEVLGKRHQDTITTYGNIGTTYCNLAMYEEALKYQKKSLDISIEMLGENHPDTATSYNDIGVTYGYLGMYEEELEYVKKSLDISLEILGEKHPDTAISYSDIGMTYYDMGRYEDALGYQKKAVGIFQEILGEKHPDTAISYDNIGLIYGKLGQHEKALEYQKKALEIRQETLGEQHPDTVCSYCNVGSAYYDLGRDEEALEYQKKAVEICQEVIGEKHPNTASYYNNIGLTYYELGRYEEALEYQKKALEIRLEVLGEKHPDTALSYFNVGYAYYNLGRDEEALEYQKKALKIRQEVLGEKHPDTASSYGYLSETYQHIENYENALYAQLKRREILININSDATSLEDCYRLIAINNRLLKCYDAALEHAKIALEYGKQAYVSEPSKLGYTYSCLANCQEESGLYSEALQNYIKALEKFEAAKNDKAIERTKNRINDIMPIIKE